MADFAFVPESYGSGPMYVNLDYVVRIYTGLDPREPTEVVMVDGTSFQVTRSEGGKLIAQLNRCCRPRTEEQPQKVEVATAGAAAVKRTTKAAAKKRAAIKRPNNPVLS